MLFQFKEKNELNSLQLLNGESKMPGRAGVVP